MKMNNKIDKLKFYFSKHCYEILTILAVILSVSAFVYSYLNNYVVSYNDSMSHLNISRLVIDNLKPGFAQLGSVWLPMNHILSLSLIWNDWAWHSGFAGSLFSMIAYIISVLYIYKIVKSITNNKIASIIGSLAFALNLNILYLQSTPLTEPLFILLFVLSVHFFVRWVVTNDSKYLFLLGITGFFEILTRYDGWFITVVTAFLILIFQLIRHKRKFNEVIGKLIVFLFPVLFGVALWFIWNFLIFGNPLYFVFGQYSAKSQQDTIAASASLVTKGNIGMSSLVYWYDMLANVGIYVVIIALIGAIIYLLDKKAKGLAIDKLLVIVLLLSPVVFNILALYLGFSIISIPQLHLSSWREFSDQWLNVRYGIFVLPFVAIGVGLFSNFKKICAIIALLAVLFQGIAVFNQDGIISVTDGTIGLSSFVNQDIAAELRTHVQPNEKVILSASFFHPVMFRSGFDLKQFIHEGVGDEWQESLVEPEKHASWIVLSSGYVGEPVYESLVKNQNNIFLYFYKLEFKGKHADIFKLKDNNELLVKRRDDHLVIGDKNFIIKGVNSYDLAYKTKDEIDESFRWLNSIGANTVRFWLFGDGISDGFQPQAGIINEDRFRSVDLIISLAQKYNIKLIPVLVNNWSDYGGKKQYLVWTGNDLANEDLFFTDEKIVALYKNYINHVIIRTNTITNRSYKEEPSILAWEMINEPRTIDDNNEILYNWSSNIAQFIKQIDENHLILVGTEKVDLQSYNKNNICGISNIDICSTHLYLYDKEEIIYKDIYSVSSYLNKQRLYAAQQGKPILLGEFGISKSKNSFNEDPIDSMKKIIGVVNNFQYDGYLIWNWSVKPDDSFGFSPIGDINGSYGSSDLKDVLSE